MKKFDISEVDLKSIVEKMNLSIEQQHQLLQSLEPYSFIREQKFTVINVLRYLGGMMALMAFAYFFSIAWMIHPAIFALMLVTLGALIYYLSTKWTNTKPVSSRLLTLVSLGAFTGSIWTLFYIQGWLDYPWGNQNTMTSFHHWISGGWFYFECAILTCAILMFYKTRVALLTMPIALIVWYMGIDLAELFGFNSFHSKSNITALFAVILLGLGFWSDIRNREKVNTIDDYGFWFSFFGAISFTASISFTGNNSVIGFILYFSIHTAMMIFGAFWRRRIFTVVGAIALFVVVSDKFIRIFGWPSIAILGLMTLFFADYVSKHQEKWMNILFAHLPKSIVETIKLRQEHV